MTRPEVRDKEPGPDERSVTVNKVSLVRAVGHDRQPVVQGIDLTNYAFLVRLPVLLL